MKKIDTHSHSSGVSFCSQVPPEIFPSIYKAAGVDTVVITNHYSSSQMSLYASQFDEQIERFLLEYKKIRAAAAYRKVNVILGAEVAIASKTTPYTEFLLFGVDEVFLLSYPMLYNKTQEELYKICHDNGVLMYQAHPFRIEQGHKPQDPEFMDGLEINCHPAFFRYEEEVLRFANKHNLGISCGSDFHYVTQAGRGGIFVPDEVKTSKQLAKYLKATKRPKIFIDANTRIQLL